MSITISQVISHWSHFFQDFALSSKEFYSKLNTNLGAHQMPNVAIGLATHKEAGLFSASREYLRIKHGQLIFDVCAAPFGADFFISWWLYESEGGMKQLFGSSAVGNFLAARAAKRTFFQIDEEEMFRSCVHECILHTVQQVTENKGLREMTEKEKAYKVGGM